MKTQATLKILLASAALPILSGVAGAARPNILVLVADDLGGRDLGCYNPGTFYETPNLDRLARQGVMFTSGYAANPVRSPVHFSLMPGCCKETGARFLRQKGNDPKPWRPGET